MAGQQRSVRVERELLDELEQLTRARARGALGELIGSLVLQQTGQLREAVSVLVSA